MIEIFYLDVIRDTFELKDADAKQKVYNYFYRATTRVRAKKISDARKNAERNAENNENPVIQDENEL